MPRLQFMVCDLDGTLLDQFFVEADVATDVDLSRKVRDHIEHKFEVGDTLADLDEPKS